MYSREIILRKMLSVLRKINSHVWFVDHFTKNMKCLTNSALALPRQTCNSTKIIIHFNIKNNHPNIPIIFISKQPQCTFTIGITPPWCTKMIPTRGIWIVHIHNLGNCIVPVIQKTTHPTVKVHNYYPL